MLSGPTRFYEPQAFSRYIARHAIAWLPRGGTLIDLGCGTGYIAIDVADMDWDARVIGLDIDPQALTVAQTAARNMEVKVEFLLSDVFGALRASEQADVITCTVPWESPAAYDEEPSPRAAYIDDSNVYTRALVGAHRHLKDSGVFIALGSVGFDSVFASAGWVVGARFRDTDGTAIYLAAR